MLTGSILNPLNDKTYNFLSTKNIYSTEEELNDNLIQLFNSIYKPYLLANYSGKREKKKFIEDRIAFGEKEILLLKGEIKERTTLLPVTMGYTFTSKGVQLKNIKSLNLKEGKCQFPFKTQIKNKDTNKKQWKAVHECIKYSKKIYGADKLKNEKVCATSVYGTEAQGAKFRAKTWGICIDDVNKARELLKSQPKRKRRNKKANSPEKENSLKEIDSNEEIHSNQIIDKKEISLEKGNSPEEIHSSQIIECNKIKENKNCSDENLCKWVNATKRKPFCRTKFNKKKKKQQNSKKTKKKSLSVGQIALNCTQKKKDKNMDSCNGKEGCVWVSGAKRHYCKKKKRTKKN
jgi:hypothetical protein